VNDPGELDSTTRHVDDEQQHVVPNQSASETTSTAKKSIAAIAPECARKKALRWIALKHRGFRVRGKRV